MKRQRLWLVANAASGSINAERLADLRQQLEDLGDLAGESLLPGGQLPGRQELEQAGVHTLVAFGGDGTMNGIVRHLDSWSGAVLVLPGGTQNLLSHRLHGDAAPEAIVTQFAGGALERVTMPAIRSPSGMALAEVLVGPGATWSDLRESMREGDLAAMASSFAEAVRQSAGGPAVMLTDPPLGRPQGYPAVRLVPSGNRIAVEGYGPDSIADYARQGAAILLRDFRQGPHELLGRHDAMTCRSDAPIELMFDGERCTGGREERFTPGPCPVGFLASAARAMNDV